MSDKEIRIELTELQHSIEFMVNLKKQAQEIVGVRKGGQDYFMGNIGKAKEKMNICEYKSNEIIKDLVLLVDETITFLNNAKLLFEEGENYSLSKIDTLTK